MDIQLSLLQEDCFVPENENLTQIQEFYRVLQNFYGSAAGRLELCGHFPNDYDGFSIQFLVNRKYLFEYSVMRERGGVHGGIGMAIGPRFFSPHVFWSHENGERFSLEIEQADIKRNLALLDEFILSQSKKDPPDLG